jgi:hypothetical protein
LCTERVRQLQASPGVAGVCRNDELVFEFEAVEKVDAQIRVRSALLQEAVEI